jgi:hypothetical protein
MNNNFDKDTTASKLDLSNVNENSALHKLIEKLNCTTLYEQQPLKNSIMEYENLCEHDGGFLCEHKLQFIIDFICEEISCINSVSNITKQIEAEHDRFIIDALKEKAKEFNYKNIQRRKL